MKLYIKNISEVNNEELLKGYSSLSAERKAYIDNFKNEKSKKPRIIADMIARTAISDFCNIKREDILFSLSDSGKPYCSNADVHFSISHSADKVICAVSDKPVGADIELIRKINFRAADRFATNEEKKYIDQNTENFFRIWTLKEAYFKCIGSGLNSKIKNISFTVNSDLISANVEGFKFRFHDISDGYICSVCEKI